MPPNVKRMLDALSKPALRLWKENKDARQEHALARSTSLISAPWDYNEGAVDETREVTFLRDFFNLFHECLQSCETLDVVKVLIGQTLTTTPDEHMTTVITFWSESYLNEVYIFQQRLSSLVTYVERKYKRDKDFAEPIVGVCKSIQDFMNQQLGPFIQTRGKHVHERRYRNIDPELARLAILNTYIDVIGQKEFAPKRKEATDEARDWLFKQTDQARNTCWAVFDGTCQVLAEGIITENDWVIVPLPFKDNPEPFLQDFNADT